jgi:hypothetical protein
MPDKQRFYARELQSVLQPVLMAFVPAVLKGFVGVCKECEAAAGVTCPHGAGEDRFVAEAMMRCLTRATSSHNY